MKLTGLFITISIFMCFRLFGQQSDPGVKAVAKESYKKYKMPDTSYVLTFFEKRGNQYWVVEQKIEKNTIVPATPKLFYDGRTYLTLDFPVGGQDTSKPENYISEYDVKQYQLNKYYGFRGWYKDVIRELEGNASTNDEMYSLARAYSAAANALVSDQFGDAVVNEIFPKTFSVNTFSSNQFMQYRQAMQKSQLAFAELAKKDPDYSTIVGTVGVKAANEVMVEFHTILTFAYYAINQVKLPDDLYNDSVITRVKAILKSCPKKAILTSFGDNDFYPFLYMQHKLKIRPDVYVINNNLLGVDRFFVLLGSPLLALRVSRDPGIFGLVTYHQYKGVTLCPGKLLFR